MELKTAGCQAGGFFPAVVNLFYPMANLTISFALSISINPVEQ